MSGTSRRVASSAHPVAVVFACVVASAATVEVVADEIGYADLVARLGAGNVPTGAMVRVAQVEATSGTAYGPAVGDAEFAGVTFVEMSGAAGNSGHATTVAKNYYGSTLSVAPGISQVHLYEANGFIQSGYLRVGSGSALLPLVAPTGVKVFNNSWIGSVGSTTYDNDGLRRADFAMNRDGTLFCNGENNGAGSAMQPLMSEGYHGLAVGRIDGQHSAGLTPMTRDGGGRMKPEIVAPGSATSYSTPVVASCAALLYDVALSHPDLIGNLDARRPAVVKGALLAGARHRDGWSNNPSSSGATRGQTNTPLDPVYGVDVVNIDRAHLILTGGEVDAQTTVPAVSTTEGPAWGFPVSTNATNYFRFHVEEVADEVSIAATWHRIVPTTLGTPSVANYDLFLHGVSGTTIVPLVGDAGTSVFASGNVVSQSAVDNVEHLHVRGLQPGDYVIELRKQGSTGSAAVAVSWLIPSFVAPALPGDTNGDGRVDGVDLAAVLSAWGLSVPSADFDQNGIVDGADLAAVLGNWT